MRTTFSPARPGVAFTPSIQHSGRRVAAPIAPLVLLGAVGFAGCGGDSVDPNFATNNCGNATTAHCIQFSADNPQALLDATNSLQPDTTLVLGRGTFTLLNSVTVRTDGIHIVGQGIDETTLDFGDAVQQFNGIDVISDGFLVQDLTVLDSPKDAMRVEASNGVTFRRIRSTWSTPGASTNGAYGIYPVKSQNVLVEYSRAENASDAGLYVGQCQHVIVRNNVVQGNVAGLEIENTEYADVYENEALLNTGGIVVFDLPGNPIVGRDVRIFNNNIHMNNGTNFAPGGTVRYIPVGTGTFAMASRRVEIFGNTYADNNTVDIAIISGLAIESDPAVWELQTSTLVGDYSDLGLVAPTASSVANYRTENVLIHDNTHTDSGLFPDMLDPLHLGLMLGVKYSGTFVDSVLYDTIGESTFDENVPANNSNDNHICVGGNTNGTFGSLQLDKQLVSLGNDPILSLRTAPFAPFDCTTLTGTAIAPVVLPANQP